jgi:hypothetical protein
MQAPEIISEHMKVFGEGQIPRPILARGRWQAGTSGTGARDRLKCLSLAPDLV